MSNFYLLLTISCRGYNCVAQGIYESLESVIEATSSKKGSTQCCQSIDLSPRSFVCQDVTHGVDGGLSSDSRVLNHAGYVGAESLEQIGDVIFYTIFAVIDVETQIKQGGNVFFVRIGYVIFKLLE